MSVKSAIARVLRSFGQGPQAKPRVVFNRAHIFRELRPIPLRALTEEEMGWVRQILGASKEFKGLTVPQVFANSECPCGTCRTVGLEPIKLPNWEGKSGYLGGLTIHTRDRSPIQVLLHSRDGYLNEMEVIWYYFPEKFPESWEEVSRSVDVPK